MSARRVRRIVAAALVLAALWPAVQHAIARQWGSDPWELFGWAMYSVVHPRIQLELAVRVDGEEHALRPAGTQGEQVRRWLRRRTALGRLVSEEAFARGLMEAHPDWDAVVLRMHHWRLDAETARLAVEVEERVVEREAELR